MNPTENPDSSAPDPIDEWNHSLTDEYDHEHPCPSNRCIAVMRRIGYDIPEEITCCVCYARSMEQGHPPISGRIT